MPNSAKPVIALADLWSIYKFAPNPQQEEAINHCIGPLFLTAGPGSGKTRVLLWRTVNLIVFHGVKPEEIFLSTFTEKAALQLKEGLQALLGVVTNQTGQPYDISKMAIGTVHSICQKLIQDRRFSADGSRRSSPVLMDELGQYFRLYNRRSWKELLEVGGFPDEETAQRAINRYLDGRNLYSRHEAVVNCMKLFNRFSEECLDPEKVGQNGEPELEALLKMYRHYLNGLQSNPRVPVVDFSLLQQQALLAIDSFADAGKVFKHIIIDEYQDTNNIQERIFFALAQGHQNICVVGDDDQALYRFRGATVENLVEFEERCQRYLGQKPKRIDLSVNYRSKSHIVEFYKNFIDRSNWRKNSGTGFYRVADKKITANNTERAPFVVRTRRNSQENAYAEIAAFIQQLKATGKVEDYNQVAVLYPAMKNNTRVQGLKDALEAINIPVYAPRAGRFLEVEEASAIYGLLFHIFGRPSHQGSASPGLQEFRDWTLRSMAFAGNLMQNDPYLSTFVQDRQVELATLVRDYELLITFSEKKKWQLEAPFQELMIRELADISGLSAKARQSLTRRGFLKAVQASIAQRRPFSLQYVINRLTSLDWNILDLFYQITGFDHFRKMFQLAEDGTDEGPICNLGLVTQYLSRFNEEYSSVISARFLQDLGFVHTFFSSFTYALWRRGESEFENADDPFPKGRVPFLTIHQSKGLEFPVVVLGSLYRMERAPDKAECLIRELLGKEGEPLDRIAHFDNMRMFYVGLSRAENMLILPDVTGRGISVSEPFKTILGEGSLPLLENFNPDTLPDAKLKGEEIGRFYSYTGDYLSYQQCPRSYMIFRKYGFAPARSLTMFFGSLVHRTIEDLHRLLIHERSLQSDQK
jgi:DNA helicase-2/ATP-dependent DNA helicase PcrA